MEARKGIHCWSQTSDFECLSKTTVIHLIIIFCLFFIFSGWIIGISTLFLKFEVASISCMNSASIFKSDLAITKSMQHNNEKRRISYIQKHLCPSSHACHLVKRNLERTLDCYVILHTIRKVKFLSKNPILTRLHFKKIFFLEKFLKLWISRKKVLK